MEHKRFTVLKHKRGKKGKRKVEEGEFKKKEKQRRGKTRRPNACFRTSTSTATRVNTGASRSSRGARRHARPHLVPCVDALELRMGGKVRAVHFQTHIYREKVLGNNARAVPPLSAQVQTRSSLVKQQERERGRGSGEETYHG